MTEPAVDPKHESVPEWVKQEKQAHESETGGQQPAVEQPEDGEDTSPE